jgi:hypothetical protein
MGVGCDFNEWSELGAAVFFPVSAELILAEWLEWTWSAGAVRDRPLSSSEGKS